jgi:enoyl-CoA hydratase/carnithine racemase
MVRLNRGVTNALDLEVVTELGKTLRGLGADPGVASLVLGTVSEKFFSIGFDIPGLYELERAEFERFYQTFNQTCMDLYTLPKPSVAAITGHAIAGGCILALCCDCRVIADGRRLMGLNEIRLGVPVPYLAHRVLEQIVGVRNARELVECGDFYSPEASLRWGLVDEVSPAAEALRRSIEWADLLGALPSAAFRLIKRNRVEEIEAQVLARREEKQNHFMECWYSDRARELLRKAMERF